ncbi:ABC transporter substrate-binding protein [Nocardioides zeae]|uniref:Amino acid ABC transporter substrate-binding protein n=1 Tax=Nocardioides zeae TaxID=1457234 RepID=A0A6P0HM24_9ACTN|nr:ABC transporter substrate-binding protein [Nocardioides zeae]NEN79732.1 amino acid ABC transporter substrate-binding protein [Nocardioides zeae]
MRRALSLTASMMLAVPLAACGGSSDGGGSGPVTVGVLLPLTGASAQGAEQAENALELRLDQINAEGGVDGRDVELKVYDTKLDPATATQQAQRAISQDRVAALIGPWTSTEALAVGEVVERAGVVTINNSASAPAITEDKEYVFRTSPRTPDLAVAIAQVGTGTGAANGALLYDGSSFGLGAKDPIEAAAEDEGLDLVTSVEYPIGASDVSAQVASVVEKDPGVVIIAGAAGADYGLIAKAMQEQGLAVPIIGLSPIVSPDALRIGEGAYAALPGVYTVGCVDETKPAYSELLEDYNEEFTPVEVLPEQALQAVDALNWIVAGLGETQGEGSDELVGALTSLPAVESVGGRTGARQQFTTEDHDAYGEGYLVPYQVVDGGLAQADLDVD